MPDTNGPDRCGVGIRGVAMTIDSVVWVALFMLVVTLVGAVTGKLETGGGEVSSQLDGTPALVALALWFAASIGYHTLLEWRFGKTIGKYLVSIQVRGPDGSTPSLRSSLARNVTRLVDWLPFLYVVGIMLIALSEQNERLGDKLGRTAVVRP